MTDDDYDDGDGSGLSGWGFYELGRQAGESDRDASDTALAFSRILHRKLNPQPYVDVSALVAERNHYYDQVQALRLENAKLRDSIEVWKENFYAFREWGRGLKRDLENERQSKG